MSWLGRSALLLLACALLAQVKPEEFHFLRLEYTDLPNARRGFSRGWWRQDWPEADVHFTQGVARLTRIQIGDPEHLRLTDNRIFDYPWLYSTQNGYWDLRDAEVFRLRQFLERGGFLMTDDFYGAQDWRLFRETMKRVFPEREIEEIDITDPALQILFDIPERVQIPGLRHLRRGPGGRAFVQMPGQPEWHVIRDGKGRVMVAVNFNMDIGDAWEHADMPEYPEEMTSLAYRFGLNYIVYAMTH